MVREVCSKIEYDKYIVADIGKNDYSSKIVGSSPSNIIEECASVAKVIVADSEQELSEWFSEQYKEKAL